MTTVFEPPLRRRAPNHQKRKRQPSDDEDGYASGDDPHDHNQSDEDASNIHRANPLTEPAEASDSRPDLLDNVAPTPDTRHRTDLKYQHFAVLNALLHTTLQKGDIARANRVFGLLLRFEPPSLQFHGSHVDLRCHNLWAIGSEILLRRSLSDNEDGEPTDAAYEDAKAFHERLILQYPPRLKTTSLVITALRKRGDPLYQPRYATALDFYPSLIGLWVKQVDNRNRRRQRRIRELQEPEPVSGNLDLPYMDNQREIEELSRACVNDVNAVLDRLEQMTHGPPYYLDPILARMKADVLTWMSDVVAAAGREEEEIKNWKSLAKEAKGKTIELRQKLDDDDDDDDDDDGDGDDDDDDRVQA